MTSEPEIVVTANDRQVLIIPRYTKVSYFKAVMMFIRYLIYG